MPDPTELLTLTSDGGATTFDAPRSALEFWQARGYELAEPAADTEPDPDPEAADDGDQADELGDLPAPTDPDADPDPDA